MIAYHLINPNKTITDKQSLWVGEHISACEFCCGTVESYLAGMKKMGSQLLLFTEGDQLLGATYLRGIDALHNATEIHMHISNPEYRPKLMLYFFRHRFCQKIIIETLFPRLETIYAPYHKDIFDWGKNNLLERIAGTMHYKAIRYTEDFPDFLIKERCTGLYIIELDRAKVVAQS